jgi:RNA polymerase sigma factor (sigma-70 family)
MPYAQHIQQSTHREQGVPDGALVTQALAGDSSAFDVLVNRYRNVLASYVGGFFPDHEQVLDVLQHVFLQLYLSLPVLLTTVSLHAWLFHVARNRCLDELCRLHRHAALPFSTLAWEDGEEEQSVVAAIPNPAPLPEEVVEMRDRYSSLHQAIATLPPKFRSIVILHCFKQLTFRRSRACCTCPLRPSRAITTAHCCTCAGHWWPTYTLHSSRSAKFVVWNPINFFTRPPTLSFTALA